MIYAEHIKINKAVGITLDINEYDIERIYTGVREGANDLKTDKDYYINHTSGTHDVAVSGMYKQGYKYSYEGGVRNDKAVTVYLKHNAENKLPSYVYPDEIVINMKYPCG